MIRVRNSEVVASQSQKGIDSKRGFLMYFFLYDAVQRTRGIIQKYFIQM